MSQKYLETFEKKEKERSQKNILSEYETMIYQVVKSRYLPVF